MAFQAVPDTAIITVNFNVNGALVQNGFYAERTGGYDQTEMDALSNAVDAWVGTSYLPLMSTTVIYDNTHIRGLDSINDIESINSDATGPGGVATPPLPANCAKSIKLSSGLTGRSSRGRIYTVGMSGADLGADENECSTTYRTAILAAIDGLRVIINATVWSPVIVSRFTLGVARSSGVTFAWTATNMVNLTMNSRRDRLPG